MRILHPQVAAIDCEDCSKFAYDFQTGERMLHGGDPIPVRKPPCQDDPKFCPKVRPGHSDWTPANQEIVQLYRFCRSVDRWPDDMWFTRYRRIIEETEQQAERHRERREQNDFLTMVLRVARKR